MRLSNAVYLAHPWRITAVAPDFKLLDAWDLPVEGSRADFDVFLQVMRTLNPRQSAPGLVRALFWLRDRLGHWFRWNDGGWDGRTVKLPIPGCTETTLRVRLPEDLKQSVPTSEDGTAKFRALYCTSSECAEELSNATVHAIKHLVWVDQGGGLYRGQMGVFVKPRGWFGSFYLALIGPFRRLLVYPAGVRLIGNAWAARFG
jgi:Protein of unknown function (DUF2867)